MKKTVLCAALGCTLLISACGKGGGELPKDIQDVGGTITKDEDLLPTPDVSIAGNIELMELPAETLTTDIVKSWYAEAIEGDYTASGEEEGMLEENAALKSGGSIRISTYYGYYYSISFLFDSSLESEYMTGQAAANVSIYLGRALTDDEQLSLLEGIQSVKLGGEMSYLQAFAGMMNGYVSKEGDLICIQCS